MYQPRMQYLLSILESGGSLNLSCVCNSFHDWDTQNTVRLTCAYLNFLRYTEGRSAPLERGGDEPRG